MGGPSSGQKQARDINLQNAKKQQAIGDTNTGRYNALYGELNPFYTNEMNNGLPFFNNLADYGAGTTARAFAPAFGDLARRTQSLGYAPSGFKTAAYSDLASQKAKAFDDSLTNALYSNFQAKQQGAQGNAGLAQIYNPLPFYGGSGSAAAQGMQPLQPQQNPWMGVLGGAVQGATAIPW